MVRPLGFDAIRAAQHNWEQRGLPEPEAMTAAISIMRAEQIIGEAVDQALRPLGLTFPRWEILMLLSFSRQGSLPMTKIGDRLRQDPTGISRLVDKLEKQGLVRRDAHPTDRRTTLAVLLPAGQKVARRGVIAVGRVRFGLSLGNADLLELTRIITDLRSQAGDFPTPTQPP
jgi:DNA-binding MarR family transcriptional regulator